MHPAVIAQIAQRRGQTVRVHRVGVEVGEPLRQPGRGLQGVAPSVALALVPVQVPHVVAPADHLADEAFHRGQRRRAVAVGLLGPVGDLERVEQAEVHRGRQQRVRHPRIGRQHRVLVRAERGQPVLDELLQRRLGLAPGGREPPRTVAADEGHVTVTFPAVEVAAHLVVDVVLARPPGRFHRQRRRALGWWLAVVGVEVPAPPARLAGVHQDAVAAPDVAVEVLHDQPPAARRPRWRNRPGT